MYDKILSLLNLKDIFNLLEELEGWFDGADMLMKKTKMLNQKFQLFRNLKKLYASDYKASVLYRFSNATYNPKIKQGITISLKTGNKPIQSWTYSKPSALGVYKLIYANDIKKKNKMGLLLKANFSAQDIVFSWDIAFKFLTDVKDLLPKIEKLDSENYLSYKSIVRYGFICFERIKEQKEVVVYIPEKKSCKVEEILNKERNE